MALTIDPATKIVTIPQADLTFISGTLYEMDTNQFRLDLGALLDDEDYIWLPPAFNHNTEVTVAGTTFARTIEMINGYSITFSPDSQWSVRFVGSNNNLFDIENGILNQNQVQVIPGNSAGLIRGDIGEQIVEGSITTQQVLRLILSTLGGKVSGVTTTTERFRDTADTKDRVVVTLDGNNNRTGVTLDLD